MKIACLNALIVSCFCTVICLAQSQSSSPFYYDFEDEAPVLDEEIFYQPESSFPHKSVLDKIGEVSGVSAINSSHVYVFHRADRKWLPDSFDQNNVFTKQDLGPIKKPTIMLLVDGKIVKEFGEGLFFMPHSITVDRDGSIWTSDVALHQIFKFDKNDLSKPSLVLGVRFVPGNDAQHFCKPTDIKVASNGDFFVSDGYCNNRVLKFKKDGQLITSWGHKTLLEAGEYELDLPHGLALDEAGDALLVADRQNNRVVVFSAGLQEDSAPGKYLSEYSVPEHAYAVDINPINNEVYIVTGEEKGSSVHVMDLISHDLVQSIPGLGMGHAITSLKDTLGFVVGSLIPKCPTAGNCAINTAIGNQMHGGLFMYHA